MTLFKKIPVNCIYDVDKYLNYYGKEAKMPYLNFRDENKLFCDTVDDILVTFKNEETEQARNALFCLYAEIVGYRNALTNMWFALERYNFPVSVYNSMIGTR